MLCTLAAELEQVRHPDGMAVFRSPALNALGVPHAFTTRSGPDRREMDVGELNAPLAELLARAAGARSAPMQVARQVHGAHVHHVGAEVLADPPEVDALVTERADRLLLVRSADCVPVLVAGAGGSRVAAVHAGWRGILAGVIPATLEALGGRSWAAAIGPCLSSEHFEVGAEVAEGFELAGLGDFVERERWPRAHVDLRGAALSQLEAGGVRRVDVATSCTWEEDTLFSHRRDVTHRGQSRTGRLGAVIGSAGAMRLD